MGYYDVAQVCLKGHVVNDSHLSFPQGNRTFCEACGAKTITECPKCSTSIRGSYQAEGIIGLGHMEKPPTFCVGCGSPYPWAGWRQRFLGSGRADRPKEPTAAGEPLPDQWKRKILSRPILAVGFIAVLALLWVAEFVGFDNLSKIYRSDSPAVQTAQPAPNQSTPDAAVNEHPLCYYLAIDAYETQGQTEYANITFELGGRTFTYDDNDRRSARFLILKGFDRGTYTFKATFPFFNSKAVTNLVAELKLGDRPYYHLKWEPWTQVPPVTHVGITPVTEAEFKAALRPDIIIPSCAATPHGVSDGQ